MQLGGGVSNKCYSPVPPHQLMDCAEVMNVAAQLGTVLIVYTELLETTDFITIYCCRL